MTVTVTGSTLTLAEVVTVARDNVQVQLDGNAVERMRSSRQVVERVVKHDEPVYGLTTGVAELKRVRVDPRELERFNADMIRTHRIAQGPIAGADVVRAALLRLLNGFASGYPGVRPELAEVLVGALNKGSRPTVRSLGSFGQSDLGPNADIAAELFSDITLAPGEALALLNHNAFSTGAAALGISDAIQLADALTIAGALSLEAFAANLSIIHPVVAASRPFAGIQKVVAQLTALLEGSYLWRDGAARNLQDPLTFRSLPQGLGALWDVLSHATNQLIIELNASQGNPIVALDDRRVISVANFEVLPLSAALDFIRIAFAPALTSGVERSLKLLAAPWSGLPPGLNPHGGAGLGLGELGIAQQALVAEARLLAQPVSLEVVSSSLAEGIEDRITMAPLSARRLHELVALGRRATAIELVVAAQAVEVRKANPLGQGTGQAFSFVREHVPFFESAADFPSNLEGVVAMVGSTDFARLAERAVVAG